MQSEDYEATSLVMSSMESVKAFIENNINSNIDNEVVITGGGEIYNELLPYCDTIYLTKYYEQFEADTFFPVLNTKEWEAIYQSAYKQYKNKKYKFFIYKRMQNQKQNTKSSTWK